MTERQSAITPVRQEQRPARNRPFGWGGSPFGSLQRFADEMDRMFEDFGFGQRWNAPSWWNAPSSRETGTYAWAPEVEVFHNNNNELTIRADLPGLKKDEVSVEVTDNAVTIQGERKREREEDREGYYRSERTYGSFYRVIPLPEGTISEQAKARFQNGVLEVTIPAPPASKGRKLEITEGTKK